MRFEKFTKYLVHNFKLTKFNQLEGFLSFNEAYALYRTAKSLKIRSNVIEIGSWKGKSTYCIAKGLLKKSKIFAIDPFNAFGDDEAKIEYERKKGIEPLINQFWSNMADCNITNKIIPCIGFAEEYKDFISEASFIFIDGDHSIAGCEKDFLMYQSKLINEKIIAFHDFYPDRDDLGPTYVVKKYLLDNDNWIKIGVFDSLIIFRKK